MSDSSKENLYRAFLIECKKGLKNMSLRTFEEILKDYEETEEFAKKFQETPMYKEQMAKMHEALFSNEAMLAMSKDFFLKEKYKDYMIWDYEDYAEAEKHYLEKKGEWNEEYQKVYDKIIAEYHCYERKISIRRKQI